MVNEHPSDTAAIAHWLSAARRACADAQHELAHSLCMRVLEHTQAHAQSLPASAAQLRAPQAEALGLLAGIAFAHGNYGRAEMILQRAIATNAPGATSAHASTALPGAGPATSARLYAQLAQALSMQDKPIAAITAARTAALLAPTDALSCDSIGVVLSRAGEHNEALPYFTRAVQLAPSNADFQYNYGAALQFAGSLTAAEAAYARAIALDPALHRAYPAYAQLHDFAETDAQDAQDAKWLQQLTERFSAAAQQGHSESAPADGAPSDGAPADGALLLGHALATTLEKRREPIAALHVLQRAKFNKAQSLQHDPQRDSVLFAAAEQLLHAPSHSEVSTLASTAPIFVVGLPRSGTTLVERILSSHSLVRSAGELPHFSATVKQLTRTAGPFVLDAATLHAALRVPPEQIGRDYLQRTQTLQRDAAHFIDKMPLNFFYAALLHRALPQARIICLRRHPTDACLSNYRQLFNTRVPYYNYAYDLAHTAHYVALFERYRRTLQATLPETQFLAFDYDALVREQAPQTRRLLAFCGLPWEPTCLAFERNSAAVATASSAQVRRPLYATASGRWRQYGDALDAVRAVFEQHGLQVGN